MINRTVDLNKFFKPAFASKARIKLIYGGAGSGKSEAMARYILSQFLTIKGCNILICRKIQTTMSSSVFALVKKIIKSWDIESTLLINNTEKFIKNKMGNTIFFKGLDDPEKIKSITAENGDIEKIWIEEASDITEDDFNQLNLRLRGDSKLHKELILTFNPISEDHWIKRRWFDNDISDDIYILKSTYKNNSFIDANYKQELESLALTDPYFYQVYCLGEWGSMEENAVIIPYNIIFKARENKIKNVYGGIDIGVDPARYGDDDAVIYGKVGLKVSDKVVLKKCSLVELADAVINMINKLKKHEQQPIKLKIDVTGLGSGVVDILKAKKLNNTEIIEVNFGAAAKNEDKYSNIVTEMYFEAKEIISELELISDEKCFSELSRRKYKFDNKSRYQIESKDDYKKRIGHSPDSADAFVLMCYQPSIRKLTATEAFYKLNR